MQLKWERLLWCVQEIEMRMKVAPPETGLASLRFPHSVPTLSRLMP
jgi:hypothetical protein